MVDLDLSLARAQRILNRRWRRAFPGLLLPIAAYIASIVTISLAYFARSGRFQFEKTSLIDWIIAGVLVFVAAAGGWQIRRERRASPGIIVNRDELTDLVTLTRHEATRSVVN